MSTAVTFQNAERINRSLTADAERRLLRCIAVRLPRAINSDHLTLLGFISQLLAGLSYALCTYSSLGLLAASAFIVLNWFGDSLDGTVARVRNEQRPRYGFYVDHIVDAFGATALMTGLALSGYLHWIVAAAMLTAFLLCSIESFLATYTLGRFHLSHAIFGPTEVRILLIIGNCFLLHDPHAHLFGRAFLLFDVGGALAALGMFAMAAVAALRHTRTLYDIERIR